MAKFNPKDDKFREGYKDQKQFDRIVPVDGVYDVVNIKGGMQIVGAKKTEKLRLIAHVLHVVESEDKAGSIKMVGGTMGIDLWMNLTKDANAQRVVNMAIACGVDYEFDPEDRDELIRKVLTGVPYRIKIRVEKSQGATRDYYNVDPVLVQHLNLDTRRKYTEAADWKKIVPKPEDRRLEDADYSEPKADGGGRRGGRRLDSPSSSAGETQTSDPFSAGGGAGDDDGDLPF